MKRYIYPLTFIPRLPQPVISLNPYKCCGDLFLISKEKYLFSDYSFPKTFSKNGIYVHIGHPFIAFLDDEQMGMIESAFSKIGTGFAFNFVSKEFIEHNIFVIPLIHKEGESDWDASMEWISYFENPTSISVIMNKYFYKYDKKNQGESLKSYCKENAAMIDRFIDFVSQIDVPLEQFVKETPEENQIELSKKDIIAIYTIVALHEHLFSSIAIVDIFNIDKGIMQKKYFLPYLVHLSSNVNEMVPDSDFTYKEHYEKITNADIDNSSFLITSCLKEFYNGLNGFYETFTEYPCAYCKENQRFLEIGKNIKLISQLYKRIPTDFNLEINNKFIKRIPMDIYNIVYFPKIILCTMSLVGRILKEQVKPCINLKNSDEIVMNAAKNIQEKMYYKFKNYSFLKTAITDATYPQLSNLSLDDYQRMEYLGDCVLDIVVTFAIFNANEDSDEGEMTFMKHSFVSNHTFSHLAYALGIHNNLITIKQTNYQVDKKPLADVFESVFGAIFLDSNLSECFRVFQHVVIEYRSLLDKLLAQQTIATPTLNFIEKLSPDSYGRLYMHVNEIIDSPITRNTIESLFKIKLEQMSKVAKFDKDDKIHLPLHEGNDCLSLFQYSLTHSGKQNYERLEFIGDIIVKFSVGLFSYFTCPTARESGLGTSSSYYKSNDKLGRCSIILGLYKHAIFPKEMEESVLVAMKDVSDQTYALHKSHGDLFESTTAALAMTQGLYFSIMYVKNNVIGDKFENSPDDAEFDLKSKFVILSQKHIHYTPDFYQICFGEEWYTYVSINGYQIPVYSQNKNRFKSFISLSEKLLKDIGDNPDEYYSKIQQKIKERENECESQKESFNAKINLRSNK